MVQAFSRLKRVLGERGMSVPDLQRRLEQHGLSVNLKSLYRLVKDDQPLERLNLRVAGMICQVGEVPLSNLIAFEMTEGPTPAPLGDEAGAAGRAHGRQ